MRISQCTAALRSFPRYFSAILVITGLAWIFPQASAESLVEDFEGHAIGEAPGDPWTEINDGPGSGSVLVIEDQDNLFGKGNENRILEYRKEETDSPQNMVTEGSFSAAVASVRFQFYQPDDGRDEHTWLMLYAGSRSTGNRAQVINFGADGDTIGTSATYERGMVNEVELVVNNGAEPIVYGDEHLLDGGQVDIWINGTLSEEGFSAQNNQRGAISTIEFNTSGAREHVFYLDDIIVESLPHEVVEGPETGLADDFESHTPGEGPGQPWTEVNDGPGSGSILVTEDQGDHFGKGTDNRMLEYLKDETDSAQSIITENTFSAEVASIRFQFYQPDDAFNEQTWIILYAGSRSTGNRAQVMDFGAGGNTIGTSATYERGVVNEVELVVNNSSGTIVYGDNRVLGGGQVDIWINGELAEEGFSAQNNQRGAISAFEFNTSSARQHHFFLDDFVIEPIEAVEAPPQVVFQEDFTGHAHGSIPGNPWTNIVEGPDRGTIRVYRDADNLFGEGSSNHYMEYKAFDGSTLTAIAGNAFSAEVITFSMRFLAPDDDEFPEHTWLILYAGSRSGDNRAQVINFGADGNILGESAAYELDAVNEADLIMNNSASAVTYGNGHTLDPGTVDIWINGVLAEAGFSAQNNRLGPITQFEFNTSGANRQLLLFDEIIVWDQPVVDEAEVIQPFDEWRANFFTAEELEDETISGPDADASGDGIVNLLAYALGLDPTTPAPREELPSGIMTEDGLTLTYTRVKDATDVEYSVEVSGDLIEWASGEEFVEEIVVTDHGDTETIVALDKLSDGPDAEERRFIRLRVGL